MKTRLSVFVFLWIVFSSGLTGAAVELLQTGQVSCYDATGSSEACVSTGQDGDTIVGAPWVSPRLINNGNGTATDNMTGLMWTTNANLPSGTRTWQQALDYIAGMNSGAYSNYGYTDWRLPNVVELLSLVHHENSNPALPGNHPFSNVQSAAATYYYTSNTYPGYANPSSGVWIVELHNGGVASGASKAGTRYVWPVRGGSEGEVSLPRRRDKSRAMLREMTATSKPELCGLHRDSSTMATALLLIDLRG